MKKLFFGLKLMTCLLFITSCSKRNIPQQTNAQSTIDYKTDPKTSSNATINAPAAKPKKPEALPQTITVNDAAASKSVDGRLYYDVNGKRYWKNYKDGKYYLFNKSMYENPDFKPPVKKD